MVYIDSFLSANKLQVHHAFHDEIVTEKVIFDRDGEDFSAL
jgi:hypothetical protein